VPLVVMPCYQMVKLVRQPGRMRKVKKARAAAFFAVAGALAAGILLIPTPLRVSGTLVLTAAKPALVYAEGPGRLVELKVRDGDPVRAGDMIAELVNLDLLREREAKQADQSVHTIKAEAIRATSLDPGDRKLALQFQEHADMLEPALTKLGEQIDKMKLVAPRDGYAMGVPHPETLGQWVQPGKPFCEVGDPKKLEAHLILDQTDIDLVRPDRRCWLKFYGLSDRTVRGRVVEVAKRNRDEVPPELSNLAGGDIATKPDEKTGAAKPLSAVYEVIIPVDNADLTLQPGLRGFAKIDGGHSSLGWWLWRLITKTFHFTL
jgi:putative peptide zinc metalloprotease protein